MNHVIETLVSAIAEPEVSGVPHKSGLSDKVLDAPSLSSDTPEHIETEITERLHTLLSAAKPCDGHTGALYEVKLRDAGRHYGDWSIEAATVAVMLLEDACLKEAAEKLTMADWSEEINARLFATMLGLYNEGAPITQESIFAAYRTRFPKHSIALLASHLAACCQSGCNPEHIRMYIKKLQGATQVRTNGYYAATEYHEPLTVDLLRARLPLVMAVEETWYQYNQGIWSSENQNMVRAVAANCIHTSERSSFRVTCVIKHLEHIVQAPASSLSGGYKFDEEGRILINANNVLLRVGNCGDIEVLPHSPEHRFIAKLDAAYDPTAKPTLFEKTLAEAIPDEEDRDLYQMFCGNLLYPSCKFEVAMVNYGPGGTSKSTLAGAVRDAMGDSLTGAVGLEALCKTGSYSLPTLKYKMLNLGSELNGSEIEESSNFKTLVSGEFMNARQIYEAPSEMRTTCKLWFLSNNMPRFRYGTDAELRRLRIIHFDQMPKIKDPQLKDKLKLEISGILNWMIEGLRKILQVREFPSGGKTARLMIEGFNRNNDPIGAFVATRCKRDPNARVSKQEVLKAFSDWCEEYGVGGQAIESVFFKRLRNRFPELQYPRIKVGNDRPYFVLGLSLLPDTGASDDPELKAAIRAHIAEIVSQPESAPED